MSERAGHDVADSAPHLMDTIAARRVIQYLLALPVHERMAAMGMRPTYDTYENKPTWVEP